MKSQSGGILSLEKLAMKIKSNNHNLSTWISMETEIVSIDEHMFGILWIMQLLESQGYGVR